MNQLSNVEVPPLQPVKHWLETLPSPYKEKAFVYLLEDTKDLPCRGVRQALTSAFVWKSTVDGYQYWHELYKQF